VYGDASQASVNIHQRGAIRTIVRTMKRITALGPIRSVACARNVNGTGWLSVGTVTVSGGRTGTASPKETRLTVPNWLFVIEQLFVFCTVFVVLTGATIINIIEHIKDKEK